MENVVCILDRSCRQNIVLGVYYIRPLREYRRNTVGREKLVKQLPPEIIQRNVPKISVGLEPFRSYLTFGTM